MNQPEGIIMIVQNLYHANLKIDAEGTVTLENAWQLARSEPAAELKALLDEARAWAGKIGDPFRIPAADGSYTFSSTILVSGIECRPVNLAVCQVIFSGTEFTTAGGSGGSGSGGDGSDSGESGSDSGSSGGSGGGTAAIVATGTVSDAYGSDGAHRRTRSFRPWPRSRPNWSPGRARYSTGKAERSSAKAVPSPSPAWPRTSRWSPAKRRSPNSGCPSPAATTTDSKPGPPSGSRPPANTRSSLRSIRSAARKPGRRTVPAHRRRIQTGRQDRLRSHAQNPQGGNPPRRRSPQRGVRRNFPFRRDPPRNRLEGALAGRRGGSAGLLPADRNRAGRLGRTRLHHHQDLPARLSDQEYEVTVEAQHSGNPDLYVRYSLEDRSHLDTRTDVAVDMVEFHVADDMAGYRKLPDGQYLPIPNWSALRGCPFQSDGRLSEAMIEKTVRCLVITVSVYVSGEAADQIDSLADWAASRIFNGEVAGIDGSYLKTAQHCKETYSDSGRLYTRITRSYQKSPRA
jgi:hypothetical protein